MKKYVKESITHVSLDPHVLTTPGSFIDFNSLLLFIPRYVLLQSERLPRPAFPGIDIDQVLSPNPDHTQIPRMRHHRLQPHQQPRTVVPRFRTHAPPPSP